MIKCQNFQKFLNPSVLFLKILPFPSIGSTSHKFSTASASLIEPSSICDLTTESTDKLSSIKLTQVLINLERERNPNLAYTLFNESSSLGLRLHVSIYAVIIRILASHSMHYKLISLFSAIISSNGDLGFGLSALFSHFPQGKHSSHWVTVASDSLIQAFVISNKPSESAVDAYRKLVSLGFTPSVRACNCLLNFVGKSSDFERVLEVYDQMMVFGMDPDAYTYTILIKSFCRDGKLDEAFAVLDRMEETRVKPDLVTFRTIVNYCDSVISCLCKEKNLEEAEKVFKDMRRHGLVPKASSYHYLVRAYCEEENIWRATYLLDEMELNNININHVVLSYLLKSLSDMGEYYLALEHFHKFKDSGRYVDNVLYNIAIDAHCKIKNMRDAMILFEEMRIQRLAPDKKHFTTLISGFCKLGDVHNAQKVFDDMVENGVEPDLVTYKLLIRVFCRKGCIVEARTCVRSMQGRGLQCDALTYSWAIESMCRGGNLEKAKELFCQLEGELRNKGTRGQLDERGIRQCVSIYSAMVSGYLMSGRTREAYRLFERWLKQGRSFDNFVASKLIHQLFKEGDVERASKVKSMLKIGVAPGLISYNQSTSSYSQVNDVEKVDFYFKDFVKGKLSPDVVTYTTLINGYCKINCMQEAEKLFREMVQRGIEPDLIACTVLLDGYLKDILQKDWEIINKGRRKTGVEARHSYMVKQLEIQKLEPDLVWYTVLIDGFSKVGCVQRAEKYFNEMIIRGLIPDSFPYTALIHGYCSRRDVYKAAALLRELLDKGIQPDEHVSIAWRKLQSLIDPDW